VLTLAANLQEPDDLQFGPDGTLYVSDVGDGTIRRLDANGQMTLFLSALSEPEGMVFLPDGSMLLVEQGRNRILRWDSAARTLSPWLSLPNPTGLLGVDGITSETNPNQPGAVIIPDSPNNQLLRVSLDGRSITVIARGLLRPTSAWVEGDGSILVVEENGSALVRVHAGGRLERLARVPTPDDVVEDAAGYIFVSTLGDGAVHVIDPHTNRDQLLVQGLSNPQGLALDKRGNLYVSDSGHHSLLKILIRP
jgi:sugar lactone lactonase YvrE